MTSKPRWRQVFDKVERAVGSPLEDVAASSRFVDVMSVGIKARRLAGRTVRGAVHGVTGKVLHAVNIPTQDDVERLNAHLAALAGEIRAIEQVQRTGAASSTKPRPVKAVPTEAVPTKAVPTKAVPTKAVPTKAVLAKAAAGTVRAVTSGAARRTPSSKPNASGPSDD